MLILELLYFMLPAFLANMAPVFAKGHLKFLNRPLDFGLSLFGRPLLGDNKTWRGLVVGVLVGALVGLLVGACGNNRHSKGIWQSRLRLYPDAFRELSTPLPPIDEQRVIAAFLDWETVKIDALVAKIHEAIDRLKELRTALISAAVTGKIDVREADSPPEGGAAAQPSPP